MVTIKRLIRQLPDPPQRMGGWDPLLNRDVRTGSHCAPADLASQLGSCPICAEMTGFSANS